MAQCYGLYLDITLNPHALIGGAFGSEWIMIVQYWTGWFIIVLGMYDGFTGGTGPTLGVGDTSHRITAWIE